MTSKVVAMKNSQGWGLFWNVQLNYKTAVTSGDVVDMWFSPKWAKDTRSATYVHYTCKDTVSATHTFTTATYKGTADLSATTRTAAVSGLTRTTLRNAWQDGEFA